MVTGSLSHLDVRQSLDQLVSDLRAAVGTNVLGVALYGGLAKGRYTPGISDVNLLVVLRDAGYGALVALAPALTAARRRSRVAAWIVTPHDLSTAARLFPIKVHDIQAAHEVLFGDVHLGTLAVDRGVLELRVQQQLWNVAYRLRQRAVERGSDSRVLWGGILASLPKLAVVLESILRLRGASVPRDRPGVLRAAAVSLGLPAERMEPWASVHRDQPAPDEATITRRYAEYLALLHDLSTKIEALR